MDTTAGATVPSSPASDFEYRIFITSLSISSGSAGGGYDLTIVGSNLSPSMDSNNVFIGNGENAICEITSINSTHITCTVPPMLEEYTAGVPLEVVVTGRLVEDSVCSDGTNTCNLFTYEETIDNKVKVPEVLYVYGGVLVTIEG